MIDFLLSGRTEVTEQSLLVLCPLL